MTEAREALLKKLIIEIRENASFNRDEEDGDSLEDAYHCGLNHGRIDLAEELELLIDEAGE